MTVTSMKALVLSQYAPADNLTLTNPSTFSSNRGSGVNPVDALIRAGYLAKNIPLSLPSVLGIDFAGEVVAVGPDSTFTPGNYVYGKFGTLAHSNGAYSEYIVADEKRDALALKPLELSFAEAAGVGTVAITAWVGVHEYNKVQKDQRILIIGGSSAVGQYAIQFASIAGAHVTTICSAANFQLVKDHGAHVAIDYKGDWKTELAKQESFDAIFDTVGGNYYDDAIKMLKENATGIYASTVFPTKGKYVAALPVAYLKDQIHPLFLSKQLKPLKVTTFKLEDGVKAHKAIESHRTVGKIVLTP